jgi:hypothetical protein
MKKTYALLFASLGLVSVAACGPAVKTGTLPDQQLQQPRAKSIEKHEVVVDNTTVSTETLSALNQSAGSPSFGIVGAYYQLPMAKPAGASQVSGQIAGIPYDQTRVVPDTQRPWALVAAPAAEAEALQSTISALLDAGVMLKEVSMADAGKIIEAEKAAAASNSLASFNQLTPSGVELLISLQKGHGMAGALYIGRVVRTSDGALLALASRPDAGALSLRPLVYELVQKSLQRLAAQK